jgi:hypothetical protein
MIDTEESDDPGEPPKTRKEHKRRGRPRGLGLPRQAEPRYVRLFQQHRYEALSPIDKFEDHTWKAQPLLDSEILNIAWKADEKERFFTALARCGKGNLAEVAGRVATKSLAEVAAYVGLLEEETTRRRESRKNKETTPRNRVYQYSKVPAAVEVNEDWLAIEASLSRQLITLDDQDEEEEEQDIPEDMLLNVENANDLAEW